MIYDGPTRCPKCGNKLQLCSETYAKNYDGIIDEEYKYLICTKCHYKIETHRKIMRKIKWRVKHE